MDKILTKLPDEVLMFIALVQNNDLDLIKRILNEEVIVGSKLDNELNKVFKTVGLTTNNLQGVGTTINLGKLLKCYYNIYKANFSERLRKCFSKLDRYTQTYEVSVSLDLSKHPEMNPKHHPSDECLPESLVNDLKSIGVSCNKNGFTDDKSGYTILEFDIERSPKDRYNEITKFITDKLINYGFDKNRIGITKWD